MENLFRLKSCWSFDGAQIRILRISCFFCEWEGRKKNLHYTDYKWKRRTTHTKGDPCIDFQPLVPASVIILPPLHIKLGLVKNFLKSLVQKQKLDKKDGRCSDESVEFLQMVFPQLTAAKLNEGKYVDIKFNIF